MASIWCSTVGAGLSLAATVYATEVVARVAGVLCVILAAVGGVIEWRRNRRGACPWRFTRTLRRNALAAGVVVGAVVTVWPSPPRGTMGEVGRMVMGYAAFWVLGVFLIRSLSRCGAASEWFGAEVGEATADYPRDGHMRQTISWLDRLVLGCLPLVAVLYLVRTTDAWIGASIVAGVVVAIGAVWWFAEVLRRPAGRRITDPPSSVLVIGVLWVFLGQITAAAGRDEASKQLLEGGWLITGGGVGLTMWLWRVRPLLLKAKGMREARSADSISR